MGDEFRREIAAASLPSTRVTNVTKSDCGIALVKKGRKAKVVSGPQIGWKGQGRKSADVEMGCLHFLPKYSTSRLAVNGDWYGTRAKVRKLLRPLARAAALSCWTRAGSTWHASRTVCFWGGGSGGMRGRMMMPLSSTGLSLSMAWCRSRTTSLGRTGKNGRHRNAPMWMSERV
jgi:hypothetical protein